MTAKEAAQKTWQAVSAKSAAIFLIGGVAAIVAGKFIEGADSATLYGWLAGGWGLAHSLIERTAKRTGDEFETRVWRNFGKHEAQLEQGERDHAACEEQHAETKGEIVRLRRDVEEIATAVETVKPGWKLGLGAEA